MTNQYQKALDVVKGAIGKPITNPIRIANAIRKLQKLVDKELKKK